MSKKFDIAQQNQLDQVQVTLQDFSLPSLTECEDCGNEIPLKRQRYGAVTLCFENKKNKNNMQKGTFK